jgi:hypothetical protein
VKDKGMERKYEEKMEAIRGKCKVGTIKTEWYIMSKHRHTYHDREKYYVLGVGTRKLSVLKQLTWTAGLDSDEKIHFFIKSRQTTVMQL